MQPSRTKATAIFAIVLVMANGCAHENMARPPLAEDIARLNVLAESGGMRIEPVQPLPCVGGSCGPPTMDAARIASWDHRQIAFWTKNIERRTLPSDLVASISVPDRPRGAAVGAAVGVGVGLLQVAALFFLLRGTPGDPDARSCGDLCVLRMTPIFVLPFVAFGGIVGYAVGGRRTFHFDVAGR